MHSLSLRNRDYKNRGLKILVTGLITLSFLFSSFSVFAKEKEQNLFQIAQGIKVKLTTNTSNIKSGNTLEINLQYQFERPGVKPGETITFYLPKTLYNIHPNFPKQHFNNVRVIDTDKGKEVIATINQRASEEGIGGYVHINAMVKNVQKPTTQSITVKVGDNTQKTNITISPGDVNPIITPQNSALVKQIKGTNYRDEKGRSAGTIYEPVLGKLCHYDIYVNGKFQNLENAVLSDKMPVGASLNTSSIKILKVLKNGTYSDVTKEILSRNKGNISKGEIKLDFRSITDEYKVSYTTTINQEENNYINTAYLKTDNNTYKSTAIEKRYKDDTLIQKECFGTTSQTGDDGKTYKVASLNDVINYMIVVNPNSMDLSNVVINDKIPKGMTIVGNSVSIVKRNLKGHDTYVTSNFKNKITTENNNLKINLGKIHDIYMILYEAKITSIQKSYVNNAIINCLNDDNNKNQSNGCIVKYKMNSGCINGMKYVDKSILQKKDNQIVTYTIDLDSYGFFKKNYLNIVDKIDPRVKILSVTVPGNFTYKLDKKTNTVTAKNNIKGMDYGEKSKIIIKVDFSNLECGTTVLNSATINKMNTNTVSTKKGYEFEAMKIDALTGHGLKGAKFDLLDSSGRVIETLTTNSNGIIKSDVDNIGKYYLKEIQAPKGYALVKNKIPFEVKSNDIGTVLNLPAIKEMKIFNPSEGGVLPPVPSKPDHGHLIPPAPIKPDHGHIAQPEAKHTGTIVQNPHKKNNINITESNKGNKDKISKAYVSNRVVEKNNKTYEYTLNKAYATPFNKEIKARLPQTGDKLNNRTLLIGGAALIALGGVALYERKRSENTKK